MNPRIIGWLSLSILAFFALWLFVGLVIFNNPDAREGPPETVAQLVEDRTAQEGQGAAIFVVNMIFSLLITAIFVALYHYFRSEAPVAALLGLVCLPVFLALTNLFTGLQVTLVPLLNRLYELPEYREAVTLLLRPFLPGGHAAQLTNLWALPFILLGIPTVLFGVMMLRRGVLLKIAGALLILNGVGYLSALINLIGDSAVVRALGGIGGFAFLAALLLLAIAFLRRRGTERLAAAPASA
ncbi:MAG: DUF4386 family protein [Acidobacteria bacterium]|nr:DUF4386 family protein [Acidobacteriota bacterium]